MQAVREEEKKKRKETHTRQLSGGERTDDYQERLSTAQTRWAIGWKPLIVPADLSCLPLSEYQMVPICCVSGGGDIPRRGPTHTMETGEGNLMEISECSSPCSLKVSLLNRLSAGWLLVIHSERQTDRQKHKRERVCA